MLIKRLWIVSLSLFLFLSHGYCYVKTASLTDKEIIERLTRLEEGQKALKELMDKRFEDINKRFEDINKRFEDINKRFEDINKRFEDINKRFEDINKRFEDINKRFEDIDRKFELMNKRIDDLNKRMNDLVNIMSTMMVVFGGLVVAMMGLVFWDRRTLIDKAVKKVETDSRLISVLREIAKTDKRVAEALKAFGLL